ncbi:hypothetical protein T06_9840, partial [Trichinella sp. T6]
LDRRREMRCLIATASTLHPGCSPPPVARRSKRQPVDPTAFRASSRGGFYWRRIFLLLARMSALRARCWPIYASGNLHWPTVLVIRQPALLP